MAKFGGRWFCYHHSLRFSEEKTFLRLVIRNFNSQTRFTPAKTFFRLNGLLRLDWTQHKILFFLFLIKPLLKQIIKLPLFHRSIFPRRSSFCFLFGYFFKHSLRSLHMGIIGDLFPGRIGRLLSLFSDSSHVFVRRLGWRP